MGRTSYHSGDRWEQVRGIFAWDECNETGKRFLDICSLNQLSVMNTWFRKTKQYMSTWQHPTTKKWHMIDYVVVHKSQHSVCMDVQVMRGANCWTDHRLVRMRVRLQLPKQKRAQGGGVPLAIYNLKNKEVRDECQSAVDGELASCPYGT